VYAIGSVDLRVIRVPRGIDRRLRVIGQLVGADSQFAVADALLKVNGQTLNIGQAFFNAI
jgi:hypothetical protein